MQVQLIFDVHANCELLRPAIYEKSNFISVLSKYYRVAFISLNGGKWAHYQFKIAVEADTSVFLKFSWSIMWLVPRQVKECSQWNDFR